jgi:hypothetical protein
VKGLPAPVLACVLERCPARRETRIPGRKAEPLERGSPEELREPALRGGLGKRRRGPDGREHGDAVDRLALGHEHFARGVRRHHVPELVLGNFARRELAGREVEEGDSGAAAAPAEGGQVVRQRGRQGLGLEHGARGDDPGDLAPDESLRLPGVFDLVADGHAIPRGDELGNVSLDRVMRHPAHRRLDVRVPMP